MPPAVFSIPEAVELGRFVPAAYDLFAANDLAAFTPPAGYTLVSKVYADDLTDTTPEFKVFGFIARSGPDVIVAIRGTGGLLEWLMDLHFAQVPIPYVQAGRTERGFTGFYSTFRSGPDTTNPRVIDAMRAVLADGTVRTMLAIDMAGNGVFPSPSVYTFASPKVGDKVFAGTYDNLVPSSRRMVNLTDVVPHLPPRLAGYVDVDAEVPINSGAGSRHNVRCWYALLTYLHTLEPSVALDVGCVPE
jgi:predicted lipase